MDGKWEVLDVKELHDGESFQLQLAEIELPDKTKVEREVFSVPANHGTASALITTPDRGTLFVWRHRFITDTWTWQLPTGRIDKRETNAKAAERIALEHTGWQGAKFDKLLSFQPLGARIDEQVHGYIATDATFTEHPRDKNEVGDISWLTLEEITKLVEKGDISDGPTLAITFYALSKGLLRA